MKTLTDTQYIHALIAEGEHQQQDFKFEISDARKIAKTLSAFSNTDGGRLLIGVKDNGKIAETYNIGGFNEWKNIDIIKVVIKTVDRLLGRPEGADLDLITYVTDRKGHDMRYAIDSRKLQKELGWEPSLQFEEGIEETVKWYLEN